MPTQADNSDALLAIMGMGAGAVGDAFRKMGVAEGEMGLASMRYDRKTFERINRVAFALLCPNELLRNKGDDVYAVHCRELIDRVADGASDRAVAEATDAECLCLIMVQATKAPLEHDYAVLADRLFRKLMGPEAAAKLGEEPWQESYKGAMDETLAEVRRKLRGKTGREV